MKKSTIEETLEFDEKARNMPCYENFLTWIPIKFKRDNKIITIGRFKACLRRALTTPNPNWNLSEVEKRKYSVQSKFGVFGCDRCQREVENYWPRSILFEKENGATIIKPTPEIKKQLKQKILEFIKNDCVGNVIIEKQIEKPKTAMDYVNERLAEEEREFADKDVPF